MEHLQRVWHANRERLPFRTPGSVPQFWDLLVLQILRPDSSNLPCLYSTFHLEYPLVLFRFCFAIHVLILYYLLIKQKRSTEGCSKFKSQETRQVQERLVSTLEHMQVPKWDQVSGGVSVLCWHGAPVAYVLWKPCTIR